MKVNRGRFERSLIISSIKESSNVNKTMSNQSIMEYIEKSLDGFTLKELQYYSILLLFISALGFLCHFIVVSILVYQQIRRAQIKRKNFMYKSVQTSINGNNNNNNNNDTNLNGLPSKSECSLDEMQNETFLNSPKHHHEHIEFRPNQALINNNQQQYNNYVTYAFVFHQTLVDLIRILYCFFYANNIYYEYKLYMLIRENPTELAASNFNDLKENGLKKLASRSDLTYNFGHIYDSYCIQMASFYSVLTMVTIVNILTILISETCRFYDLKLNSSDTSNYCCVLFGILLIWTSSLIIISSLMLVGVADSAAPTWKCNLAESESTTRSLVINVVWFFLVTFIILISFSYSFSLYKELRKIDHEDNRFSLYTINASLMAFKSELLERQIKIVKQTKKRLFILIMLIVIYCITFVPNFITTILKNTLFATQGSLRPFNLIFSILALANPTLNSLVLLILCIRSDDNYLNMRYENDDEKQVGSVKGSLKKWVNWVSLRRDMSVEATNAMIVTKGGGGGGVCSNKRMGSEDEGSLPLNEFDPCLNSRVKLEEEDSCLVVCDDECIKIKNSSSNFPNTISAISVNPVLPASSVGKTHQLTHQNSLNQTSVKDFYSKVGNRLGKL